ncbi:MAG: pyridoxine 5'-phosphate synthase [Gammaproteobacteria bacterium]|nr:MAG: pyridoxine 5'-phosphate synthase [Gammaproteobacteria bacterium]
MSVNSKVRLGVNLDHVMTIRQARFTPYPDLKQAIKLSEQAGADGITMHLREDRRHIQDDDVYLAKEVIQSSMNLEMAATNEMRDIALKVKPGNCCIVPEHRQELTTEGGLDVIKHSARIKDVTASLTEANIAVSLFIEPDFNVIDASAEAGAPVIELHTGTYASSEGDKQSQELERIKKAVAHAASLGLVVNAGHGLHYENVAAIANIERMYELNIGHSIVAYALFVGLETAVREMREKMDAKP